MNDPKLALDQIRNILSEPLKWDWPGQLAAYSSIMILCRELSDHTKDHLQKGRAYALENVGKLEWSVGAIFGLDITNGHDANHHHVSALGYILAIESVIESE